MVQTVIRYYRLIAKSRRVLSKLKVEMEVYFLKLEESEKVLEEIANASKQTFEEALRNERLDVAAMEAENGFSVIYFKEIKGGIFQAREVDLVLKGTPEKLRRAEIYINSQNCSLTKSKTVKNASMAFTVYIKNSSQLKERWKIIKRIIEDTCPKIKLDCKFSYGHIFSGDFSGYMASNGSGNIIGNVEEVLIARDLLANSKLVELKEEHINFF